MKADDVSCVLLADRHHGLTEGLCGLLETMFDTVVMVADEASLQNSAIKLEPSVAVMDLALARGDGLGAVRRLRARCPDLKLLLLSQHDDPNICHAALEAGADAFVLKRSITNDLVEAIESIQKNKQFVSPEIQKATHK